MNINFLFLNNISSEFCESKRLELKLVFNMSPHYQNKLKTMQEDYLKRTWV